MTVPSFAAAIRPGNGFMFHCPTVDRDARYMACVFMRHAHWMGKEIPAKDCACAMRGGKCPAVVMLKMEMRGEATFFDDTPTMHRVPKEAVEAVQNIILIPSQANGDTLTPEQQTRLFCKSGFKSHTTGEGQTQEAMPQTHGKRRSRKPSVTTDQSSQNGDLTEGLSGLVHDKSSLMNAAIAKEKS